jgi:hypothetical protein
MGFWKIKSIENHHPDYFSIRQLYASGNFLYQPLVPNTRPGRNMLRLDAGVGLTGDSFADSTVQDVLEINGTLFVAGLFSAINQTPAYYFGYSHQEATSVVEFGGDEEGPMAFPNPCSGKTLHLSGLPTDMLGMEALLTNERGQQLGARKLEHNAQVQIGDLPSGTYILSWPNGRFVRFTLTP